MLFSERKHELTADRDRLREEVNVLALQLRLTKEVQNRSESLTARVDGCTGTEEPEALVTRAEINVVPMSGDGTGKELTKFSREDSQKSLRRDTLDLSAEALDSMENVQFLGEFTRQCTK